MIRQENRLVPSWLVVTLFAACMLWIGLAILQPVQDSDLWWHLASGRDMVQNRHIPSVDVFSLTASGTRWINSYWLYDVLVYLLFTHLGVVGLILPHVFLVFGIFYFADRRLKEQEVHWILRLAALAALFYGAGPSGAYWGVQASLVSLFFVSFLFYGLDAWRRKGWTSRLWWWVLLFLVWANLHRGFVIGLGMAGFYVLNDNEGDKRKRTWSWVLLCTAVTLLTPHPLGLFQMIWDDFSLSPDRISGWITPTLGTMKLLSISITLYWVLYASRFKSALQSWPLGLLAVLLTVGSLRSMVFIPYFMVFAVPEMACRLSLLMQNKKMWSKKSEALGAAILVGLFTGGIRQARPAFAIPRSSVFDFIKNENIEGPFYNDYLFGGQWMWAFGGHPPVFIDGRYPAVEGYKPLLREITEASSGPTRWNQFLDRYNIQTALVKYYWESPRPSVYEAIFPRQKWALVYWDDDGCLFLRRGKRNQAVIARRQFLTVWPDAKRLYAIKVLRKMVPAERRQFGEELVRNAELHPDSRHTQEMISLFLAHHLEK